MGIHVLGCVQRVIESKKMFGYLLDFSGIPRLHDTLNQSILQKLIPYFRCSDNSVTVHTKCQYRGRPFCWTKQQQNKKCQRRKFGGRAATKRNVYLFVYLCVCMRVPPKFNEKKSVFFLCADFFILDIPVWFACIGRCVCVCFCIRRIDDADDFIVFVAVVVVVVVAAAAAAVVVVVVVVAVYWWFFCVFFSSVVLLFQIQFIDEIMRKLFNSLYFNWVKSFETYFLISFSSFFFLSCFKWLLFKYILFYSSSKCFKLNKKRKKNW